MVLGHKDSVLNATLAKERDPFIGIKSFAFKIFVESVIFLCADITVYWIGPAPGDFLTNRGGRVPVDKYADFFVTEPLRTCIVLRGALFATVDSSA